MGLAGGIDLGGTKIDARVFDPGRDWALISHVEMPTPAGDYAGLIDGLARQVGWLTEQGAESIGIGAPGLIHGETGQMLTANLPATGKSIRADLAAVTGKDIPVVNDCRAFTLSEARLGAGRAYRAVAGLVMGTGVAGGFVRDGQLLTGRNGQAGEFGHMPIAHGAIARHGLAELACGCGRVGCYETYCSGPGLVRLAKALTGEARSPEDLSAAARAGDRQADRLLGIWAEIAGEMINSILLVLDPDVIVLGGGLSRMPDIVERLTSAASGCLLAQTSMPPVVLAEGGDRSGARGAALLALHQGEGDRDD